jgi:hypothetical protein
MVMISTAGTAMADINGSMLLKGDLEGANGHGPRLGLSGGVI